MYFEKGKIFTSGRRRKIREEKKKQILERNKDLRGRSYTWEGDIYQRRKRKTGRSQEQIFPRFQSKPTMPE